MGTFVFLKKRIKPQPSRTSVVVGCISGLCTFIQMGNKRSIRYWALGRWICIQMCIASQMSGLKQSLENWKHYNALMEDTTLQEAILIFHSYIPGDISNFALATKLVRIFIWIFLTIYKIYHLRRHRAWKTSFGPPCLCRCTDLLHLTPRQQFLAKCLNHPKAHY